MNFHSTTGALCLAENATHTLHNILTLRGAEVRDARGWSRHIAEAIELRSSTTPTSPSPRTTGRRGVATTSSASSPSSATSTPTCTTRRWRRMNQGTSAPRSPRARAAAGARRRSGTAAAHGSVSHNVKADLLRQYFPGLQLVGRRSIWKVEQSKADLRRERGEAPGCKRYSAPRSVRPRARLGRQRGAQRVAWRTTHSGALGATRRRAPLRRRALRRQQARPRRDGGVLPRTARVDAPLAAADPRGHDDDRPVQDRSEATRSTRCSATRSSASRRGSSTASSRARGGWSRRPRSRSRIALALVIGRQAGGAADRSCSSSPT